MSEKQRSLCKDVYRAHDESCVWPMLNFYKLQTMKFIEINWLSQNLATARLKDFLARNLTVNYYNKLATMHRNRFSAILYIISQNSLITLVKSGITTKY